MAFLMIVDDDDDFASSAALMLKKAGHQVAVESDVQKVLPALQQHQPDLLILDVMFPHDDQAGFRLARQIRQQPNLGKVPILMLSSINNRLSLGFTASDIDGKWLPVSDFIEKPIDLPSLRQKVSNMLGLSV